jgi:hypothetical protein
MVSNDYGNSFINKFTNNINCKSIAMSSSGQYQYIVTNTIIYYSNNYGNNWVVISVYNNQYNKCVISSSGQIVILMNNGSIATSKNYGISFTKYSIPNSSLDDIAISSSGEHQTCFQDGGKIFVSNDYGTTWNNIVIEKSWKSVSISASGQYQVIVSSNSGIYTSEDYGKNWKQNLTTTTLSCVSVAISSSGQYMNVLAENINTYYLCNNLRALGLQAIIETIGITGGYLSYNQTNNSIAYNTNKTFVIDHPIDNNKYLVHSSLEGPESGVYYRGKGEIVDNISTTIQLPDYASSLASDFNIQVTSIYNGIKRKYYVSEVENNEFKVYGENGKFYWLVNAKRLNIIVEPNKDETVIKGNGPYKWI